MTTARFDKASAARRVVALGSFDGVHYAHRALLMQARTEAMLQKAAATVLTFSEDPSLSLGRPQKLLNSFSERERRLADANVDEILYLSFDAVRDMTPEAFFALVCARLTPVSFVCGYNYTFGRGGAGDTALLSRLCADAGVGLTVVDPVSLGGFTVSASLIRSFIERGEIAAANRLLGYPCGFTAPVVRGAGRGRTFGFPTINQPLPDGRALPPNGVYLSLVTIDGTAHPAVTDVGVKPTVSDAAAPAAESFLLSFDGSLYGQNVRLSFLDRLRDERRFSSVDELTAQVGRDIAAARRFFDE